MKEIDRIKTMYHGSKFIIKALLELDPKRYVKDCHAVRKAYKKMKHQRGDWSSRFSLYHEVQGLSAVHLKEKQPRKKTLEPIACLDVRNIKKPVLQLGAEQKVLTEFTNKSLPEFAAYVGDEIYLSIGFRKAFYPNSPLPMHHSVFMLTDGRHHGLFGFNVPGNFQFCMRNDLVNQVSHQYTFYDELTIRGNKDQLLDLVSRMENYGNKMKYCIATNNCFSPVISALLDADKVGRPEANGFILPKDYKDRLLVVISKEHNLGLGILTNMDLEPLLEVASSHVLQTVSQLTR